MRKILIVDDEPNIVMSLEYIFKKENFKVYIARDGAEAIQIAEDVIPDIMVLDIMMPNVDGYQVIKHFKKHIELKHVKVVFLSAKNKQSDIELGMKLGADKYLAKPFSTKNLVKEVKQLLG